MERPLPVFGYDHAPHGHAEVIFRQRARAGRQRAAGRGPRLRDRQGRLGPRAHPPLHAPDWRGRARAGADVPAPGRVAFGRPVADQGVTRERIANARILIDQGALSGAQRPPT